MKIFSPIKTVTTLLISTCFLLSFTAVSFANETSEGATVPVPDMVTMVDIGAKKCIPCKMMAPIIVELEQEYKDRAAIVFVDVWENPKAGAKYTIRVIPTQIFYDADGKEVLRHEGFYAKTAIVAELTKLGVK